MTATPWQQSCKGGMPTRYVLILVASSAMLSLYLLRLNMNIVIVGMVNYTAIPHVNYTLSASECGEQNETQHSGPSVDGEFAWDEQLQSLITGSFFWGYLVTQLIGGRFAEIFGTKYIFGTCQAAAVLITCCLPVLAEAGVVFFIIGRVLLGMTQGVCIPALQPLLAKWAPKTERSTMSSLIFSASQLGTIFGLPLSGYIAAELGWRAVFYIEAAIAALLIVFWLLFVYDSPQKHPRISLEEKLLIEKSTDHNRSTKPLNIPWKGIFTSPPFWALLVTSVGNNWGYYMLLTEVPIYMKTMLHFNIKSNALLSASPYLIMWVFNLGVAQLCDLAARKKWASINVIRKTANTIGQLGPAICLLAVSFVGCHRLPTVILLMCAVGLQGAYYSGYLINQLDIAPNFAGTIYGITSGCASFSSWLAPLTVATLTEGNQTLAQWRIAFYIASGIWIVTSIVFMVFGSTDEQPWNRPIIPNESANKLLPESIVKCKQQQAV